MDGGLILELYSRDGVGTMISTDFYEGMIPTELSATRSRSYSLQVIPFYYACALGIRKARLSDVDAVQRLLQPLEREGVLVKRSRNELEAMMQDFIVIEREMKVRIAYAAFNSLTLEGVEA